MSRPAFAAALVTCLLTAATPTSAQNAERYLDQFLDRAVSPREDFFHYSVGKWLREHPIPKSERSWGVSDVIQEETYQRLLDLSKAAAAARSQAGTNQQKIGDFWYAAMDSATIAKQGFAPLDSEFARIKAIKDLSSLAAVVARLQYIGVGPLYSSFIIQDEKNSDRYAVHLYQGGLGLPDRDYYFDTDDRARMLRREYVAHVGRMLRLLGADPATATKQASR
jgi:putative endopeptidase